MDKELLEYYAGDEFVAGVWKGKYALRKGSTLEKTPAAMHWRMAESLGKIENGYIGNTGPQDLSEFGKKLRESLVKTYEHGVTATDWIYSYLHDYKWIIPQGSIMTMLGNHETIGSLSNCFVIAPPSDSYGGIFRTDQEIAQLEKRRGGVGTHLNSLRPEDTLVMNAAGTSTGAHSFMGRYSNTTREVAQNGRRGALMLLMSCKHPDIFKFVKKKSDLTQVTGANVSVMLTDEFMTAALADQDYVCRFPIDSKQFAYFTTSMGTGLGFDINPDLDLEYNLLKSFIGKEGEDFQLMKIHAKELLDLIVEMAWQNGEPGVAFIDTIENYCPEGVYPLYKPVASNPCGEQWMQAYDACRLLAMNYYSCVVNPFTDQACLDYDKVYEVAYIQQRFADDIVDLEIEHVQRIIDKVKRDPEDEATKATELALWKRIKEVASASRRTGCGFTAMADMLAALNLKYDSEEAMEVIHKISKEKMRGELDCTIDLAIQRGPFEGWDPAKEIRINKELRMVGENPFYQMIVEEFPKQAKRMMKYGRRNVSWSTVAPTGTVSIVAKLTKYPNTTAGIEPPFNCYYFRNKKVNAADKEVRVDFVDQNGDSWQTYPVIMGGFKEWIDRNHHAAAFVGMDNLPKGVLDELFRKSPYYGSCANDINWEKRIEIQGIVQRYTTNAISSTLNLPNNVSKMVVGDIYNMAWRNGLKGVTVYRDGCRTGVMTNTETKRGEFTYSDSIKRPKELKADLHISTVQGQKYAVIIGLYNEKPYEIFAFRAGVHNLYQGDTGVIKKIKKGHYDFVGTRYTISTLEDQGVKKDEAVLSRLISGMLRHGAEPKHVADQIDKCDLEIVSYGKAVARVLNKYVPKEVLGEACPECKGSLRKEEGCTKCTSCGYSKC